MHSFVLLIAIATALTFPTQSPAERWVPFEANPAYEVRGTEDSNGVFRYTASRRKGQATVATKNYGVNLSNHAVTAGVGTVMGNDPETAKLLLTAPKAASSAAAEAVVCSHSDCPDGRCDRDRDRNPFTKKKPAILTVTPFQFEPWHAAAALAGFGVLVIVAIAFVAAIAFMLRALTPTISPTERPQP